MDGHVTSSSAQHSVIVNFYDFAGKFWSEPQRHRDLDPLFALEHELIAALDGKNVGELDGNEIAVDGVDGLLFLYGPDADALFGAIESILRASPVTQGGHATLRYGGHDQPNALEKYIEIKPHTH